MKSAWLILAMGAVLSAAGMSGCTSHPSGSASPASDPAPDSSVVARAHSAQPAVVATSGDPFHWLESVHGARALAWVHQQNARTEKTFMDSPEFQTTRGKILEVLNSNARIPYVRKMGKYYYNFWKDKAHPRGVWRRTTLASYKTDHPRWETVLDVDALGKKNGHPWVWKGARCLKPAYQRCLIELSPHGGDAVVIREFDVASRSFAKGGFDLPLAKSDVDWIDKNHIYVGTDFGPGSMTRSSYPRIAKEWTRGTPLSAAKTVYVGKPTDFSVRAYHEGSPGFARDFVSVSKDFFHRKLYLRRHGKLVPIDVPADASTAVHRQWLLVEPKSPWNVGGTTYVPGTLLAIQFDAFMDGKRNFDVLFRPDQHTALRSWTWTRHHLILTMLKDVKSRLTVLTPHADGSWSRASLPGVPAIGTVRALAVDSDHSDAYWLRVTGFLTPPELELGTIGDGKPTVLKQQPSFFDTSGFVVSQHFATSTDGTQIPYFEVAPKGMKLDGKNPVLEFGYGGFGVAELPRYGGEYEGAIGRGWLQRGGVYVVANIRGGSAYGPRWHKAAMQANRLKAYQDFVAVARDLIARGITSPSHIGAEGASNGGLLVGNMLVNHPQLFGAIACESPLLDMKRYIYLAAGASWTAEYGNPANPDDWAYMKSWSPYENVKKGMHYPPVLFYTTTSDDRVGPQQARKMAAKMQAMGYGDVWFYEGTGGGHGPGADHAQAAAMRALVYDFLWRKLQ